MRRTLSGLLLLAILAAPVVASAPGDPARAATPTAAEIAALVGRLGDDSFAVREAAQKALIGIGRPAADALRKALAETKDVEVRSRAMKILERVDPGWSRRQKLERARADLLREIADVKGVDVRTWGESVANPFAELTADGKKRLTAEGIDVPRLQKMRARYLSGSYGGALSKEFVNPDPDTILIVGKDFCTHGGVHSVGPVLAVEDAYFMSRVRVAGPLWFVDRAGASGRVTGTPALAAEGAGSHAARSTPDMLVGDYGWRRPKDFLRPLTTAADAKADPADAVELAKAKKDLADEVKKLRATDVKGFAKEIANPFTALTDEGKGRLRVRGVDPGRLTTMKAVYLTGSYCGANSKTFANNDPDTVLVVGKGFVTHGGVYSLGPILAVEDAHFMGGVTGADVVWFVGESFPRGRTMGAPVILAPEAGHSQMGIATRQTWRGDYGWRAPKDFAAQVKAFAAKKE